jgi:hypothetical protein
MFCDDEQSARACRALLATVRLERLWTADGPTPHAIELLEADGGPLSSGERVVLLAAFAFWNGRGSLRLAEVVEVLDVEPSEAICSLVVAVKQGADAVAEWLADYEPAGSKQVH